MAVAVSEPAVAVAVEAPVREVVREEMRPYMVAPMVTTRVEREAADDIIDESLPPEPAAHDLGSDPFFYGLRPPPLNDGRAYY